MEQTGTSLSLSSYSLLLLLMKLQVKVANEEERRERLDTEEYFCQIVCVCVCVFGCMMCVSDVLRVYLYVHFQQHAALINIIFSIVGKSIRLFNRL